VETVQSNGVLGRHTTAGGEALPTSVMGKLTAEEKAFIGDRILMEQMKAKCLEIVANKVYHLRYWILAMGPNFRVMRFFAQER